MDSSGGNKLLTLHLGTVTIPGTTAFILVPRYVLWKKSDIGTVVMELLVWKVIVFTHVRSGYC